MDLEERLRNSLMIFLDGDKTTRAEDFADIISCLSKDYCVVGCTVPINGVPPPEPEVVRWQTSEQLASIIRDQANDFRIAYIVFHKFSPNLVIKLLLCFC